MSPDLDGLDKLRSRRRPVTPPRRPVAPQAPPQPGATAPPDAPTSTAPPPHEGPPAATRSTRRSPSTTTSATPPVPDDAGRPALARGGATEQLGVRLYAHQVRGLRRLVRLLDDEEGLRRPTQAEVIQVLLDALPDAPGADLTRLADEIRAYRARIVDE